MSRYVLAEEKIHADIRQSVADNERDIVEEVQRAIEQHAVVVVGMAQNPHVKKARKLLTDSGVDFEYLEYGNYFNTWRRRNALKMWSGWPTFPMVFVKGQLIGGAEQLQNLYQSKEFEKLLAN